MGWMRNVDSLLCLCVWASYCAVGSQKGGVTFLRSLVTVIAEPVTPDLSYFLLALGAILLCFSVMEIHVVWVGLLVVDRCVMDIVPDAVVDGEDGRITALESLEPNPPVDRSFHLLLKALPSVFCFHFPTQDYILELYLHVEVFCEAFVDP